MRHKYPTRALVLSRTPIAEESTLLTLLTRDVGLVRARAQGLRKSGAKLAGTLPTLAESDVILVEGKDGWRVSGAILEENWFSRLTPLARIRAGRIAALLLRLVSGEAPDERMFDSFTSYLSTLATLPEDKHAAAECLAALRILSTLGLDAGDTLDEENGTFGEDLLERIGKDRTAYVARVNRGIAASGL